MDEHRLLKNILVMQVDETNNAKTFGYVESVNKIKYNIKSLSELIGLNEYQKLLSVSSKGLTTIFTLGQYIVIAKIKKDETEMEMLFFDFRFNYPEINNIFKDIFSQNIINHFNRLKSMQEANFNGMHDTVTLNVKVGI